MTACGATAHSVAVLDHVHVCSRPVGHTDDPKDPDHYCRTCNRFFWGRPDMRKKR